MKTTNIDTARAAIIATRTARAIRTLDRLSHYTDEASTRRYIRIMNALRKAAPAALHTFTAPTTSTTTERTRTARPAAVNHRMEERTAARAVFAAPEYQLAHKVVWAKIKGAAKRGIADPNNVYLKKYADMIQTAALSLEESRASDLQFAATVPAEMDADPYTDKPAPFTAACRACGQLEHDITKRAPKETPIDHVTDKNGTTAAERHLLDREEARTWKRRAIDVIEQLERMERITAKQAENLKHLMNGHPEKVRKPDLARAHLARILTAAGLLTTVPAWTVETDEEGKKTTKRNGTTFAIVGE